MRTIKRVTVLASEARIADENSDFIDEVGMFDECQLFLIVTAKTGSPTSLDAVVKYSLDGGTTYAAPATAEEFTQVTGSTSNQMKKLTNLGEGFRVETTLAGGSAGNGFTFSIVAVMKRLT